MHYFDKPLGTADHFWPRTATLDWCEENYVSCKYIAELWNATTNLIFILLAAYGIYMSAVQKMPIRFFLAYAAVGVIGIGSFLFHATLMYQMQLLDELPMIYCVCILTYSIFKMRSKTFRQDQYLRLLLVLDAIMVSCVYTFFKNPLFHQTAFGLHCAVLFFSFSNHYYSLPSSPQKRSLQYLLAYSWGANAFGFLCWNIDNVFCSQLRTGRHKLGGKWEWLLQFHAWWHVFTGLGAYVYVLANQWLWMMVAKEDCVGEWQIGWRFGVIPVIESVETGKLKSS